MVRKIDVAPRDERAEYSLPATWPWGQRLVRLHGATTAEQELIRRRDSWKYRPDVFPGAAQWRGECMSSLTVRLQ